MKFAYEFCAHFLLRFSLLHLLGVLSALAYNAKLKTTIFSPLPYAISFGALPWAIYLSNDSRPPLWLFLGFILVAIAHNTIHTPVRFNNDLATLSKVLISAGLVALGSNVRWAAIRKIGHKPLVMGLFAWAVVAGVALGAVKLTGL
jgi:hypothetical protein